MKKRSIFTAMAIPATAVGLLAQDTVTIRAGKLADEAVQMAQGAVGISVLSGEPGNVRFMTQDFSFIGRPVQNAPYSAEEKTESVQILGDGNRITNTTTAKVYRDSQGRTRREMTLPGFGGAPEHTMITINDPVSGVNYTLDPQMKVAHQMPGLQAVAKMKAEVANSEHIGKLKAETEARIAETRGNATYIRRGGPAPESKHEDLGTDFIEGVNVKRTRESSTIEAGAMGNEKPISILSERWYSPELQVEVKSIHNDPRMGQTTHTLTNISRAEPDASLFQVPSDYKTDEVTPGVRIQRFDYHTTNQ